MNYSKEEFNSVWKDTSKENILNQFYYEHIELQQVKQRIDKAKIEISALMSRYFFEEDFYIEDADLDKVLKILESEPNDKTNKENN